MVTSDKQIDLPSEEDEKEKVLDNLADRVIENFRKAMAYRASHQVLGKSVEEWLRRLHNAYHKIHEQEELEERQNMSSYFGLTKIKTNMTASYMRSKYININSPPFNINPTPIVELPETKQQQGFQRVLAKLLNQMIENELPPEALVGDDGFLLTQVAKFVKEQAKQAKEELRQEEFAIATEAAQRMVQLIKDQLLDGGFTNAMSEVLFDIALMPVMVLSYENETVVDYVWKKNKFVKEEIVRPTFRRVDPVNAFFAPDATNAQNGTFFIELAKRSIAQLAGFIGKEELGYFDDAIKEILEDGDNNWLGTTFETELFGSALQDEDIHILRCQMLVSGADLIDYGVKIKESEKFNYFNADIEVCDNRVIRCQLVAHPKGERTYFSASYKRIAGEPYGVSVGMMVYDRQLSINRNQYSMLLNADFAAGPMLEVNAMQFADPQHISMKPFDRIFSNPSADNPNARGITQHSVNPTFPMLFQFLTNQIRLADDECGLPAFLNGNAGLQGAGQTLGGLALMTDNAVLGLEDCAFNIDEYVIRPAITLMYCRNLLGNDDSVKADAKVVATGLLGLKAELDKAKQLAGLVPQASQLVQQGGIPQQMYADIVTEYFKTQGIDTDKYLPSNNMQVNPNPMTSQTDGLVDKRSLS